MKNAAYESNGTNWSLARDYLSYADLYSRKGDPQKEEENLNRAVEISKEGGAEGWQKKAEQEMAALS